MGHAVRCRRLEPEAVRASQSASWRQDHRRRDRHHRQGARRRLWRLLARPVWRPLLPPLLRHVAVRPYRLAWLALPAAGAELTVASNRSWHPRDRPTCPTAFAEFAGPFVPSRSAGPPSVPRIRFISREFGERVVGLRITLRIPGLGGGRVSGITRCSQRRPKIAISWPMSGAPHGQLIGGDPGGRGPPPSLASESRSICIRSPVDDVLRPAAPLDLATLAARRLASERSSSVPTNVSILPQLSRPRYRHGSKRSPFQECGRSDWTTCPRTP